jgi:hypothetical protein
MSNEERFPVILYPDELHPEDPFLKPQGGVFPARPSTVSTFTPEGQRLVRYQRKPKTSKGEE